MILGFSDIKRLVGQRYDSFRVQYLDSLLPFHLCNLNNRVAVEVLYDEKKERCVEYMYKLC